MSSFNFRFLEVFPISFRPLKKRQREVTVAAGIAAVYALYLLTSEYHNLFYDAEMYWQLGHRFYQNGHFSLLAYDDALRGYAYPLINFGCLALRKYFNVSAVTVVKIFNAGLAGLLFGIVGPRLWQAATVRAALPSVARRLLWALLGFIFWRDYFNFSMSDIPALLALGLALWQAQRSSLWAALVTGLALALAVNVRPIYQASVLPVLLLLLLSGPRPNWPARLAMFGLGLAVVLAPQWLINRRNFGVSTPMVISQSEELHIHNLYLQKLRYGLMHLKYESSVGRELPTGQLLFLDAEGQQLLQAENIREFDTFGQYLQLAAWHPFVLSSIYARHLFAGLDISQPTPYLRRWAPSAWRSGLNYSLWFWAGLVIIGGGWPSRRQALVLAGLILPCLAVLPLSMEVRFLLPLHLLLLALVAFGPWPRWATVNKRRLAVIGLTYTLFLLGCFILSARIIRAVEPRFQAYLLPGSVVVKH